ncbi:hypothetical protein PL263_18620 [Methylomonas sp. EFPC3]|uniref:hypothetical protein n=1 Tax=Methylomonas sp. EFPC3 TaxID=3021710 RepID=UPI0024165B3E|nr:hypothetical protein [Methylomonas sp. EFPC3]WFP50093.1 hypothetical protein PL263_18620 [Methylomonas sp. EFPC3]
MGRTLLIGLGRWLQSWGNRLVERYQTVNPAGDLAEAEDGAAPVAGSSARVPPPHWVALVQAEAPWLLEDYVWPETGAYRTATEPSAATRTGRPGNEPEPSRRAPAAQARAANTPAPAVAASPLAGGQPVPETTTARHHSQAQPVPSPAKLWLRRNSKVKPTLPDQTSNTQQSARPSATIEPSVGPSRRAETPRTDPPARATPISTEMGSAKPASAAATRRRIENHPAPAAAYRKQQQTARHRFEVKPAPRPATIESESAPRARQFAGQTEADRQNPPAASRRLIALAQVPARPQQTAPIQGNATRSADPIAVSHNRPPATQPLLGAVPAKPTLPTESQPAKPENWQRQNWPQLPDESADQFAQRCQRWPELPDQFLENSLQTQPPREPMARELERNRRLAQEHRGLAWNE